MDPEHAIEALSALAQSTRLDVVRRLVRRLPNSVAAGDLARELGVPANTLSTHLSILSHAGLVSGTRTGRSIRYRADLAGLQALTLFLLADCCNGRPEICAGIMDFSAAACGPGREPSQPLTAGDPA